MVTVVDIFICCFGVVWCIWIAANVLTAGDFMAGVRSIALRLCRFHD